MRFCLFLLSLFALLNPAAAQSPLQRPGVGPIGTMMRELEGQLTALWQGSRGREDTDVLARGVAAVTFTAMAIDQHLRAGGDGQEIITLAPGGGASLFQKAALFGFSEIVDVFLTVPAVRATVNDRITGLRNVRLWSVVQIVPMQSLMFCGGNRDLLLQNNSKTAAYIEAPRDDHTPYLRVRAALEAAGAIPQPEEARSLWQYMCRVKPDGVPASPSGSWQDRDGVYLKEHMPGSHDRVLAAPDMLVAIQQELIGFQKVREEMARKLRDKGLIKP